MKSNIVVYRHLFLSAIALSVSIFAFITTASAEDKTFSKFVYDSNTVIHYRFPTHSNDLVIDRSEAATSEVFIVVLEPGEAPPLHKHDDTEQIFYLLEGTGVLTIGETGKTFPVRPGDVVRVPPTVFHKIEATGGKRVRYLAVDCFMGGRPQAEPTWDAHVRVLCEEQGWDYNQVVGKKGK